MRTPRMVIIIDPGEPMTRALAALLGLGVLAAWWLLRNERMGNG